MTDLLAYTSSNRPLSVATASEYSCATQTRFSRRRVTRRSQPAKRIRLVRPLRQFDLTTFTRLDELGREATGQRLEADRAVLACRVVELDRRYVDAAARASHETP